MQLLGDSVDARLTKEWCIALEQPLYFTPTGIKRNAASFAAAIKAKAAGNSSASTGTVADAEECCKNRDVLYYCQPSKPGAAAAAEASISVGMFHLLGVHLDGPYHTGKQDASWEAAGVFTGVRVVGRKRVSMSAYVGRPLLCRFQKGKAGVAEGQGSG